MAIIIFIGAYTGALWFQYQMDFLKSQLMLMTVKARTMISTNSDTVDVVATQVGEAAESVKTGDAGRDRFWMLLNYALGMLAGGNPSEPPSSALMSSMSEYKDEANAKIDELVYWMFLCVMGGCGLAFIVLIVLWVSMIGKYKEHVFMLRQGHYWFSDKNDFPYVY